MLTEEKKKDCQERIYAANKEIAEICLKYNVEPIATGVTLAMGDTKFKNESIQTD